jgi:hypothetical protein
MSRKLKLEIEALTVESFEAAPGEATRRGTIRGNSVTEPGSDSYGEETCGGMTCAASACGGISEDWNCVTDPFGGCGGTFGGTSRWEQDHAEQC